MSLLGILFIQCSIDRTIIPINKAELKLLKEFQQLDSVHSIQISSEDEPGQKLWLCLTMVSKNGKAPLMNQKVHLYHTSNNGDYEPADLNDESTARLNGFAITDAMGRIFVQTILPGDYGSSSDNRHIHTTVEDAIPEAYDINFKQYTGLLGKNFIKGSDQHFIANLKQTKNNTLVVILTMEIKKAQ
ncbi:hypothetical protein ALE3EI_2017 [Constantimarinum furrinae]|uniref:Intradiol ring-cleavage dioxygenases domain-containing protein n=2 Tax=Constantimarinum furrinae TaxID=2562285 RepID=A0A7G8PW48_9FLAO|nr:hypothetical protein ALE3EI_2017 [Constantimarinum furrinae]